jgi:hypothetical protein
VRASLGEDTTADDVEQTLVRWARIVARAVR